MLNSTLLRCITSHLFSNLASFRAVLVTHYGVPTNQEVPFPKLIKIIFKDLDSLSNEYLTGLCFYLIDLMLVNRSSMDEEALQELFGSVIQLIELAIDRIHIVTVYFALEVLGMSPINQNSSASPRASKITTICSFPS
jgi:hypothetical protein